MAALDAVGPLDGYAECPVCFDRNMRFVNQATAQSKGYQDYLESCRRGPVTTAGSPAPSRPDASPPCPPAPGGTDGR